MSEVVALPRPHGFLDVSRDYLQLSKARIVLMVLITTAAGMLFASLHPGWALVINTLVGTALVAAGTNALNQYVEREHDARMHRTRLRPLPDGRISPNAALVFSSAIALMGTIYLGFAVNWITAALGAFTLTSYIFVYTPLKRVSPICTLIGAVPGAIPPLMGWTAVTGSVGVGGWILFGILFFWQLPHFMAISWIHREDYGRAGFAMLAVRDEKGLATAREAVGYSVALLVVSILPTFLGLTGGRYLAGSILAGLVMLGASIVFLKSRNTGSARRLFMTSNIYLIVLMVLLVLH